MRMRGVVAALFVTGLAACSEDPASPPAGPVPPAPEPSRRFLHGLYTGVSSSQLGSMVMDLAVTGNRVAGKAVTASHIFSDRETFFYLLGHVDGDTMWLFPDTVRLGYTGDEFRLEGVAQADGRWRTTFHIPSIRLHGDAMLDTLGVGTVRVESETWESTSVHSMARMGTEMWAGVPPRGYHRYGLDGSYRDLTRVELYPGVYWISDVLASNDTTLFGHQYYWEIYPDITYNRSEIIEFDTTGTIRRKYITPHRTSGLAWDGGRLWSLTIDSDSLYALDDDGNEVDAVPLTVPDFVDVAFDGTDFWFIGWHLSIIYRMSPAGEILGAWDMPDVGGWHWLQGMGWDGTYWWVSRNDYPGTIIYRLSVDP